MVRTRVKIIREILKMKVPLKYKRELIKSFRKTKFYKSKKN
jgi:hypothetical protein